MKDIKITLKGKDIMDIVAHHFGIANNKVRLMVDKLGAPYATVEIVTDYASNGVSEHGGQR